MNERQAGPDTGTPFTEAVFVALDTLAQVPAGVAQSSRPSRIGFGEIHRFATENAGAMSPELRDALAASPRLRADLRHLLARISSLHLSAQAAASSATVTTRHGAGFQMTLRESHADRSQIYVTIQFGEAATAPPSTLFVIDNNRGCRKLPLPAASAGAVQLLLEADSDLVAALRDPRTEVFMR